VVERFAILLEMSFTSFTTPSIYAIKKYLRTIPLELIEFVLFHLDEVGVVLLERTSAYGRTNAFHDKTDEQVLGA
jgi:hypothetical protein